MWHLMASALEKETEGRLDEAKGVLVKVKNGEIPAENAKTTVDWLTILSEQGNTRATELLREFVHDSVGVSEDNIAKISHCLEDSDAKKSVKHAAKRLFKTIQSRLDMTQIPKTKFVQAMKELIPDEKGKAAAAITDKIQKKDTVTEDDFVNAIAKQVTQSASLHSLHQRFDSDVDAEQYTNASVKDKILKYPGKSLSIALDEVLEYASKEGGAFIISCIPSNQIYFLAVFFLYSLITADLVFAILPLLVFLLCFLTMFISTLQMMHDKKKIGSVVKVWTEILGQYNPSLDDSTVELEYTWHSLTPYWAFFGAFFMGVVSFLLANKNYIPCSEMAEFCAFLSLGCLFAFRTGGNYATCVLAMVFNVASTLQIIVQKFPTIPVITPALNLFASPIVSFEMFPGFILHLGIPSVVYVAIPAILIKIAKDKSWSGIYRLLLPILVTFLWWQLAVLLYMYSSWKGLFRGALIMALFPLLPIFGVFAIFGAIYFVLKAFSFGAVMKAMVTLFLILVPTILSFLPDYNKQLRKNPLFATRKGKFVLAGIMLLLCTPLFIDVRSFQEVPPQDVLPWEKYVSICGHTGKGGINSADIQMKCQNLANVKVEWSGTVKSVRVSKIDNQAEALLKVLPEVLADWLKCIYGAKYPTCGDTRNGTTYLDELDPCEYKHPRRSECHLHDLNTYQFEIAVQASPTSSNQSPDVALVAGNKLKNFVRTLLPGNEVSFKGMLTEMLGVQPQSMPISVSELKCTDCPQRLDEASVIGVEKEETIAAKVWQSGYDTANFLLSPLFEYKFK
ncbi:wolframin isoform X1 [Lingula anatina]|uniref:Wolframin isoform X1 n=2 Tax=Lingula anatina TaxID=7574 RepID=A0A1S3HGL2_LINAN|nr:wolframin isoform X1 [Lingula anatina]|eukprot:XP_013385223.1 wolframin isoform X1 [Lingula anatina]